MRVKAFFTTEKAFLKNVSIVFGGRLYVAVLSLLLTPIIARLFTPTDYGEYGLFNTMVQNLVVVGSLALPLAITTARKSELNKLFNLSIAVTLFFTAFFSGILFIFKGSLDAFFSTHLFNQYWFLMLAGFFISSIMASLIAINTRLQQFKTNTTTSVIEGSSAKALNLVGGWLSLSTLGLMLSDVISKFISLVVLIKTQSKEIPIAIPSMRNAKKVLMQFKEFPSLILPSQWAGMLNNQLIIIIIAFQFSKLELGHLVMAIGLVGIPLNVITNAFQPVITERLVALNGKASIKTFFSNTILFLTIIATLLFVSLLLVPAQAFTFLLGENWEGIKPIINVLAILSIFLLIDRSFENGFIVLGKQKAVLYFSLGELVLQLAIIVFSYWFSIPFIGVLIVILGVRSLISIVRVLYLWKNTYTGQ